jgi:hypothetical protein
VVDIVTSPEKGTTPPINELDNSFRDIKGRHEMQRDGAEDGSTKSEAADTIKKGRTPARQVLVTEARRGRQSCTEILWGERGKPR